ncbi:hypothetical protein JOQ06_025156 [Pogonophryne albipinna]|uniref:Uncharacterized protein n=1 Tax=Pogonophryne albipinna TaxID=1090488 RepID=A0AAD6ARZ6_9TELE|nr:hypothetical protein JOQ06_025156 [Pogonophryne albipinna]
MVIRRPFVNAWTWRSVRSVGLAASSSDSSSSLFLSSVRCSAGRPQGPEITSFHLYPTLLFPKVLMDRKLQARPEGRL